MNYLIEVFLIQPRAKPGGAKGVEAPPLGKSKLRKKLKYRRVLICFMSQ